MGFIKEFEKFISRGNVIDMAVGVVIGGAFGKIVNSLVVSIIMPLIGYLTNGMDFSKEAWVIQKADPEKNIAEIAVGYGDLIQVTLQFFIIAFSIFVVLKLINNVKSRLEKAEPEVPAAPAGGLWPPFFLDYSISFAIIRTTSPVRPQDGLFQI